MEIENSPKPSKRWILYVIGGIVILGFLIALFIFYSKNAATPAVSASPTPTTSYTIVTGMTWYGESRIINKDLQLFDYIGSQPLLPEFQTAYYDMGMLNGDKIVKGEIPCDGPCPGFVYYFLQHDEQYTFLEVQSD